MVLNLPDDRKRLDERVDGLTGRFEVTIRPYRETRSAKQNAYLWGVVYLVMACELGELEDDVHEICKQKFLSRVVEVDGETYRVTRSTSDLKTDEFMAYIEGIRIWAATHFGIAIPTPDQVTDHMIDELRQKYQSMLFVISLSNDHD